MTSFNSLLLPPAAAVRLAQRRRRRPATANARSCSSARRGSTALLERPLRLEARWLARGRTLPAGPVAAGGAARTRAGRRDARARGDHRRLEQPRLPAARDHRARVDGRPVAGRDGAGAGRGARQPGQAPDLARDPDRHAPRRSSATTSATGSGGSFGREVLEAPGPFQRAPHAAIAAGDRFFDKHGRKAVFLARWIALVRFAAAWLAGINEMQFTRLLLLERARRDHLGDRPTASSATSAARPPPTRSPRSAIAAIVLGVAIWCAGRGQGARAPRGWHASAAASRPRSRRRSRLRTSLALELERARVDAVAHARSARDRRRTRGPGGRRSACRAPRSGP